MTRLFRERFLKFSLYAVIVFLSYVLQNTPGVLSYCGISPILVLPACLCIAAHEGPFAGGLFGFIFGFFCDTGTEIVFGFNAFFYLIFCTAAGFLAVYVLRRSVLNVMLISLSFVFLLFATEFFFVYLIFEYENLSPFFYWNIAPQIVFSALFSIPYCLLFGRLHDLFEKREEM